MTQYRVPELNTFNWQQNVISQTATPPGSPAKGDRYIVAGSATGAWSGHDGEIAWCISAAGPSWSFNTPVIGWIVFDEDAKFYYYFNGATWVELGSDKAVKISADATIYVATTGSDTTGDGSSGSPFATPQKALEYINGFYLDAGVTITIQLADGHYTLTTNITCSHPQGKQIQITGTTTYSKTLNSIQSSSGAAGGWTYIFNLADVDNIAVGDAVLIPQSVSGGTRPKYISGCFIISNVDTGNKRITVSNKSKYASASSGNVTGTVTIVKTVITNTTSEFILELTNSAFLETLTKVVLVGGGTNVAGIQLHGGSQLYANNGTVGITGCTYGIWARFGSRFFYDGYISDCSDTGMLLDIGVLGGSNTTPQTISGCTHGIRTTFSCTLSYIGACITGCTYGIFATANSALFIWNLTLAGCTTAVYAEHGAVVSEFTLTLLTNGTDYNPTLNSRGNDQGIIYG